MRPFGSFAGRLVLDAGNWRENRSKLGGKDSNLDRGHQKPACCRYTTPEGVGQKLTSRSRCSHKGFHKGLRDFGVERDVARRDAAQSGALRFATSSQRPLGFATVMGSLIKKRRKRMRKKKHKKLLKKTRWQRRTQGK